MIRPEKESHPVRSPEVEVFSDHRFEEESPLHRPIEDLGETHFELVDREAVVVAGAAVGRRERPWETLRPAVEEGLHVGGPQRVARGLEGDWVGTGEKHVVERREPNPLAMELLLHPLVAIETDLHRIRQIGTDLQEAGAPVAIVDVEVGLIDGDPLAREFEADLHARAGLFMGLERAHLLLGDAEHDDAFAGREASAVTLGDRIFVLTGLEVHDRNPMACDELVDCGHEAIVHRLEQRRRRNRMTEIIAQEVTEAA